MGLEEDLKSQVERISIFINDYYFVLLLLLLLCPIHNDSMEACIINRNLYFSIFKRFVDLCCRNKLIVSIQYVQFSDR